MPAADFLGSHDLGSRGRPEYVPIAILAKGGMGRVELAIRKDGTFERLYALKRPHESLLEDPGFLPMFLDEARIAGMVRHPNVVPTIDVGEDARGPFLVMEYVEGISAAQLIADFASRGELIPLQVALGLMVDAARGLHAAHTTTDPQGHTIGIVHRDVSPTNFLIGFDGVLRVTDFGVAKALDRFTKTNSGVLKGRFGYMAPEQLQFRELDRRADIFSLGIVLYELLAARRLYVDLSDTPAPRRILTEPPPDLSEVRADAPPELVDLLFRMLAKEPDARPETAAVVAAQLDAIRAESVATEGAVPTEAFIAEHYADAQRALRERITGWVGSRSTPGRALDLGAGGAPAEDWSGQPDSAPAGALLAAARGRARARRGRRLWIAGVTVTAMLGAAGLWYWTRPSPPPARPRTTAPTTPRAASATAGGSGTVAAAAPADLAQGTDTAVPAHDAAVPPAETERTPAPRTRPRGARPRGDRNAPAGDAAPAERTGPRETWDWE